MVHAYEFEIYPTGDGWFVAEPFDMEGATEGHSYSEAEFMAADWLQVMMEHLAIHEEPFPTPTYDHEPLHKGGKVICFAVRAGRDTVRKLTASDAARKLGVTPGRVTQLLDAGQLEGWREGHRTWITADSVEARLARGPHPGRPSQKQLAV